MNITSSGLKRPQDFELCVNGSVPGATSPSGPVANGSNKRRCTNFVTPRQDSHLGGMIPLFRDSSSILTNIDDSVIETALNKMHESHNNNGTYQLTIPEIRSICELVVKDREQRLREEYDRVLAMKLVEQYDLSKANFFNHYVEQRIPASLSPPNAALAQALSMQRPATDLSHTIAATISAGSQPANLASYFQQVAATVHAQQQGASTASSPLPSGPVLLASNLDEQLATPEALFTLFGVFGDVVRVKILFNKKDNALIQMADANQAQVAQGYLDKQKVFGKLIRVTRSKHLLVQMPREGNQSDAGLTKDFTNSHLHRFKIPGSRNYQNIYPPSSTLHISNIPATIDEKDLHKAFNDACGFESSSFKFFPKDRKMALMRYNTIEQATIALIKMHNYQISEDCNLRVSYSKSVMQ